MENEVVVFSSHKLAKLAFFISLPFLGISIYLLCSPVYSRDGGALVLGAIGGAVSILSAFLWLRARNSRDKEIILRADLNGVSCGSGNTICGPVHWNEVSEIELLKLRGQKILGISVDDVDALMQSSHFYYHPFIKNNIDYGLPPICIPQMNTDSKLEDVVVALKALHAEATKDQQSRINAITRPFDIRLELPGSKSFANRALVCVALSNRPCAIRNIATADDTSLMLNVLAALGWSVTRESSSRPDVKLSPPLKPPAQPIEIYTGPAGTTTRFATAMLTAMPGEFTLDANARMRERPMGDLISVLRSLDAEITELGNAGCVPLKIKGGSLRGGECSIAGDVSSQFLSALMMVAPTRGGGVVINVDGDLVSKPYADITLQVMRDMGLPAECIERDSYTRFAIHEGEYGTSEYTVPPDGTAASYFWGAAAITGSKCIIDNLTRQDVQGDVQFVDALASMGCQVLEFPNGLGVDASSVGVLKAIDWDMSAMPDCAQTLAVVCAFADGRSRLTGLGTLRVKETDRIIALQAELAKLGVKTEAGDDWLEVQGQPELKLDSPVSIATYEDHRMAMSFALAGLRVPINIKEPDVVGKSFPNFWDVWGEFGS